MSIDLKRHKDSSSIPHHVGAFKPIYNGPVCSCEPQQPDKNCHFHGVAGEQESPATVQPQPPCPRCAELEAEWRRSNQLNEQLHAERRLVEKERDELKAKCEALEKRLVASADLAQITADLTSEGEKHFRERIEALEKALREIASKSQCECWDVPGMGSLLPYKWVGCKVHNSADPEEWCMCCIANAALAGGKETL